MGNSHCGFSGDTIIAQGSQEISLYYYMPPHAYSLSGSRYFACQTKWKYYFESSADMHSASKFVNPISRRFLCSNLVSGCKRGNSLYLVFVVFSKSNSFVGIRYYTKYFNVDS